MAKVNPNLEDLLVGFGSAPRKAEGQPVSYDGISVEVEVTDTGTYLRHTVEVDIESQPIEEKDND